MKKVNVRVNINNCNIFIQQQKWEQFLCGTVGWEQDLEAKLSSGQQFTVVDLARKKIQIE